MNKCFYCQHEGKDVNRTRVEHLGGKGMIDVPQCDDLKECRKRCQENFRRFQSEFARKAHKDA